MKKYILSHKYEKSTIGILSTDRITFKHLFFRQKIILQKYQSKHSEMHHICDELEYYIMQTSKINK